ncbi:hypothetical protein TUMEXPCC7403_18555 [Tumidithrix helvetica PCC 7403]|uniref:hypothetical protein n=1 Tax=Tumidithrix helvetica TaxID=3457545 RepID=UPI003C8DB4D0
MSSFEEIIKFREEVKRKELEKKKIEIEKLRNERNAFEQLKEAQKEFDKNHQSKNKRIEALFNSFIKSILNDFGEVV